LDRHTDPWAIFQRRSNKEQEAQKRKQDKEDIKAQLLANKQLQMSYKL
jgi:hypothetical protein